MATLIVGVDSTAMQLVLYVPGMDTFGRRETAQCASQGVPMRNRLSICAALFAAAVLANSAWCQTTDPTARLNAIQSGFATVQSNYNAAKSAIASLACVNFSVQPQLLLLGERITLTITACSHHPAQLHARGLRRVLSSEAHTAHVHSFVAKVRRLIT